MMRYYFLTEILTQIPESINNSLLELVKPFYLCLSTYKYLYEQNYST